MPFARLKAAAEVLSSAYRSGQNARAVGLEDCERVAAYAVTRLPATYAANHRVLSEVRDRVSEHEVTTLLDLGAGPGVATHAASEFFPELKSAILLERDPAFIALGRQVLAGKSLRSEWRQGDLRSVEPCPASDLVVASYALGELETGDSLTVLQKAWAAARVAMVVIEPGTPASFARVKRWRDSLLQSGAHLLAPCPGEQACPMPASDWCHFAQRVERMAIHRKLKGGSLGYEDEKFSYVAFSRASLTRAQMRVLRHPQQRPGLIELQLCSGAGIHAEKITRKDKERFRAARKVSWGDEWK